MAIQPPKRALHRNVWAVTLTSFFTDISSEMIVNLLPLFLYNVLGVRTGIIGLIEGLAEATASLLKLFSGWFSDRLRMRKPLAVVGYGLSTLAKPFLYFASSWGWVLGVRFADRVGKGIRTAPRDALLADSVGEERRGLAFGLHRAGDTAGAVIGLGIALAVVLEAQKRAVTFGRETFQTVVLLSMIPALLAVLVLVFTAVETQARGQRDAPRLNLRGLDPAFRRFLLVIILFTLGNSSDAFLILRAENAGLTVSGILGMMLTFNLVYALASSPAGALSDRIGRRKLLTAGWIVYALVYLGFAFASSGSQTWALMAVYGLYNGLTEGTAKAYVADLVPAAQRGTAFGVFHAAVGFTAFPASLAAGILWQGAGSWAGWGPPAPFIFGASLALLAVLILNASPRTAAREGV